MLLVKPDVKYIESYLEACREYKENNVTSFPLPDPDLYYQWKDIIFEKYKNNELGLNLPEGYVPSTTFWMVDEQNNWHGEINIRHELTPSLLNYGGHIGYCIRYSSWNMGIGTNMLHEALKYTRKLGLSRVLITCNDKNIGSARVIEKNGGVLENKIENVIENKTILSRRYWIDL